MNTNEKEAELPHKNADRFRSADTQDAGPV